MIPKIALIKTDKDGNKCDKKICGLYPLERNIIILSKAGVKKIFLDLNEKEKAFYSLKINKYIKKIKNISISFGSKISVREPYMSLSSNLFSQTHYFNKFFKYFKKKGNIVSPIIKSDQFLLIDDRKFKTAEKLVTDHIIGNTGGFIAQKINKRISMPISLLLAKTRIHPNYLTVINMIVGLMSSIVLLWNSYWDTVLGGFLFQLASVMDGVDGEVAKLTFKVSKIGGWLDTISDNTTLLLFVSVLSYLYYINTGGLFSLIFIGVTFAGIFTMIMAMVRYLKRYSKSGSLVAYDKEFLQRLPQNDPFIIITQKLKYLTKKEFFSLAFFAICFTGKVYLVIPLVAVIILFAAIVLVIIDLKYLKTFGIKYQ